MAELTDCNFRFKPEVVKVRSLGAIFITRRRREDGEEEGLQWLSRLEILSRRVVGLVEFNMLVR